MMDREKALQIIWDRCQHSKETEKALEVLKEDRPHGEWKPFTTIDGYTKYATCTNCGYERKVGMGCSLDIGNLPKFCEGCGADMKKEGESN